MTTTGTIKLKGKRLFLGGEQVGEILGHRQMLSWTIVANYRVMVAGKEVARGFAYFADAVKWARDVVPGLVNGG
jgi:hypothetical protein